MRQVRFVAGFAAGCATVLLAAAAYNSAQDPPEGEPTPEQMEQMWNEAMQKYGVPAEEHKALAKRVGDWTFKAEFWYAPGTEAETTEGTANYSMMMGDRYLLGEYSSSFDGQPFEGGGLTGYDRIKNEYQSIWIDNMSTAIMWMSGQSTDGGKTFEFKGQMPDPMAGAYTASRSTEKWVDDNTWVMESFGPSPIDGKEFMTMRITYTRVQ